MKAYFASAFLLAGITISSFEAQEKQSFEGTIVYRIDAQSKTPNISTENLQKLYGKQMALSIQGNKYRMSYSGLDLKEVFYLGSTNKQYALRNDIDTLFITNCTEENRQLVSPKITSGTAVILGHKCRVLTNNLGTTQNQYWFDSSIYINPSNFKNHKFGYFSVYYEKAKSPYIKYIYNGTNFSLTYTAISIQEKKLSSSVFQLPQLPQKGF